MKMQVLEEKDEPLFGRKRIVAIVEFDKATPSRAEIREAAAVRLKSDKESTMIKRIGGSFGTRKATVVIHVYSDKKNFDKYATEKVKKKHTEKKEEKKEAAPAPAEKKEEKPEEKKEEKKEEPKAEEKKEEKKPEEKKEEKPAEKREEKSE